MVQVKIEEEGNGGSWSGKQEVVGRCRSSLYSGLIVGSEDMKYTMKWLI